MWTPRFWPQPPLKLAVFEPVGRLKTGYEWGDSSLKLINRWQLRRTFSVFFCIVFCICHLLRLYRFFDIMFVLSLCLYYVCIGRLRIFDDSDDIDIHQSQDTSDQSIDILRYWQRDICIEITKTNDIDSELLSNKTPSNSNLQHDTLIAGWFGWRKRTRMSCNSNAFLRTDDRPQNWVVP